MKMVIHDDKQRQIWESLTEMLKVDNKYIIITYIICIRVDKM